MNSFFTITVNKQRFSGHIRKCLENSNKKVQVITNLKLRLSPLVFVLPILKNAQRAPRMESYTCNYKFKNMVGFNLKDELILNIKTIFMTLKT